MKTKLSEFDVYQRLILFLTENGWRIICASPPAGTNSRYRKCLLPRRDLEGSEKGPRDEVDLAAHDNEVILLAECKPRLSDSVRHYGRSSESDYAKLKRIASSFSPSQLSQLFHRAIGITIRENPLIAIVLAVGLVDYTIPFDITVMEFRLEKPRIWPVEPLLNKFI